MTAPRSRTSSPDNLAAAHPGVSERSVTVAAAPHATQGRIALYETRERRGEGPPLHRHSRGDELVFVLDGRVTFHLGEERVEGRAGSCVVLPRGGEHGYVVASERARLLIVLAPAEDGYDDCLRAMNRCASGPEPGPESKTGQEIERLVAMAARHGVEITGPRNDDGNGATPS